MIILFIVFIFVATFAWSSLSAAPWVPTWQKDLNRILKLADIKPSQIVYELGCGDGRFTQNAAKVGAKATGFEISLLPYLIALIRLLFKPQKNCRLVWGNFWNKDLSNADVVYCFLMEKIYPRLKEKLEKELKPGAKIILYVWPMPDWEPKIIDKTPNQPNIYLYVR